MLELLVRPLPPLLWLPSVSSIEDAICSHADDLVTGSVVSHSQLPPASPSPSQSASGREGRAGGGGGGDGDATSVEGVAKVGFAVGDADLDVDADLDAALLSALSGETLVSVGTWDYIK